MLDKNYFKFLSAENKDDFVSIVVCFRFDIDESKINTH